MFREYIGGPKRGGQNSVHTTYQANQPCLMMGKKNNKSRRVVCVSLYVCVASVLWRGREFLKNTDEFGEKRERRRRRRRGNMNLHLLVCNLGREGVPQRGRSKRDRSKGWQIFGCFPFDFWLNGECVCTYTYTYCTCAVHIIHECIEHIHTV